MGPGQITAATGGDHQRAIRSNLGREEYKGDGFSCLKGQLIGASQLMNYRAVMARPGDFVAAGDGLVGLWRSPYSTSTNAL
jgi:hypothetical protein